MPETQEKFYIPYTAISNFIELQIFTRRYAEPSLNVAVPIINTRVF